MSKQYATRAEKYGVIVHLLRQIIKITITHFCSGIFGEVKLGSTVQTNKQKLYLYSRWVLVQR